MKVLKIGFVGTWTDRPEAMVDFFERTLALRPMQGGDDMWAFRPPDGSIAEVFGPSQNAHLTTGPVVEFLVEDGRASAELLAQIPFTPGGLGFVEAGLGRYVDPRRRPWPRGARRDAPVPTRLVLAPDPRGRGRVPPVPSSLRLDDVGRASDGRGRLIDACPRIGSTGVGDRQPVDGICEFEDLLRQVEQLLVLLLLELDRLPLL